MPIADPLTRLVLQAALLEPERAIVAWRDALDLSPLEDWPGAMARPLPRIYLNLRHHPGFTHADRIRGVYRAAWTTNMVLLSRAAGVTRLLADRGIPYRVIKGGAVCSLTGSWGARRMGDIDLVVPRASGPALEDVLASRGFTPLFAYASGLTQGAWHDTHGGLIDVHPLPLDADVARMALGERGVLVESDGVTLHVPSRGTSMVLAAGHAMLGIADSDLMQGLLDVAILEPGADDQDVRRCLDSRFAVRSLEMVLDTLGDLGWYPSQNWAATLASARRRTSGVRDLPRQWSRNRRLLRNGLRALRSRTVSPASLWAGQPWLRRVPGYASWVALGHLRPIEAAVINRRGGFLPLPPVPIERDESVTVHFDAAPRQEAKVSSWDVDCLDARFAVHVERDSRVRIGIACDDPGAHPRTIYVNGVFLGWYPVEGSPVAEYDVLPVHGRIEGSFRTREGARSRWLRSLTLTVR